MQAVKADMGLAVLQRCLVREEIAAGNVVAPFDLPAQLQRGYYLCVCAPRGRAHPALDHFREGLLDIAAKDPDVIASRLIILWTNYTIKRLAGLICRSNSPDEF